MIVCKCLSGVGSCVRAYTFGKNVALEEALETHPGQNRSVRVDWRGQRCHLHPGVVGTGSTLPTGPSSDWPQTLF